MARRNESTALAVAMKDCRVRERELGSPLNIPWFPQKLFLGNMVETLISSEPRRSYQSLASRVNEIPERRNSGGASTHCYDFQSSVQWWLPRASCKALRLRRPASV